MFQTSLPFSLASLTFFVVLTNGNAQSKKALRFYAKGEQQMQKNQYVGATVNFTEAIAHSPNYAAAYFQRGQAFQGLGQLTAAVEDYEKAIELNYDNILPYIKVIEYHKTKGTFNRALHYIDLMMTQQPDNIAAAHYQKAQIYDQTKQVSQAIEHYKIFLKISDDEMGELRGQVKERIAQLE